MYLKIYKNDNKETKENSSNPMTSLYLLLEEWLIFVYFQEFLNDVKDDNLKILSYNNMIIEKTKDNLLKVYNSCLSDENDYHLIILKTDLIQIARVYFEFIFIPWKEFLVEYDGSQFNVFVDGEIQLPKNDTYLPLI